MSQFYLDKTIKIEEKSKWARPQVYWVLPIRKGLSLLMMGEVMTLFTCTSPVTNVHRPEM